MGSLPLLHRLFLRPTNVGSLDKFNHFFETEG